MIMNHYVLSFIIIINFIKIRIHVGANNSNKCGNYGETYNKIVFNWALPYLAKLVL